MIGGGSCCRNTNLFVVCGLWFCLCVMQSLQMSVAEASLRSSTQRITIVAAIVQLPTGLQYVSLWFEKESKETETNGVGVCLSAPAPTSCCRRQLFAIRALKASRGFWCRSSTYQSAQACRARQEPANVRALQSCKKTNQVNCSPDGPEFPKKKA